MLPESQKKKEKFLVEINRKRNAKLFRKTREEQSGYKFNETAEFLDRALAYTLNEYFEGLEALTAEFLRDNEYFDLGLLLDRTLSEPDLNTLPKLFVILNLAIVNQ